jgi:hypothetical protein
MAASMFVRRSFAKTGASSRLLLAPTTTMVSYGRRGLATSKQKRKLQEKGILKTRQGKNIEPNLTTNKVDPIQKQAEAIRQEGVNWKPIFFLGIFPVAMSSLVVLMRDDLREELEEKGISRLFRDSRSQRAEELEKKEKETGDENNQPEVQSS